MTASPSPETAQWLVPITPEILVTAAPGRGIIIAEIAPQLATWFGYTVEALRGRPLSTTLDVTLPGLLTVVEEVLRTSRPIRDYAITCTDRNGAPRTLILQAYLRPGQATGEQRSVALQFAERAAPPQAVGDGEAMPPAHGILGQASALVRVLRKIAIYGPTDAPVLITGETGTGKELVARALHDHSQRRLKPFVAINCAALSEELLESELFGHEKGAFTGAIRNHKGRFERAHGGTLFLDEIGDMPLRLQVKLLRVLEEGVIERVGGERELAVDVRLEAATNVALERAVQEGTFRADFYHRLAVLRLHLPPLRQRLEDLPVLVQHFLSLLNQKYQRQVRGCTPEALALLADYTWPGNIRELRNVLERVYVETAGEVIGRRAFDEWVEERTQYVPGAWNVEAHHAARSERPVLITPYPGAYRAVPTGLPEATALGPAIEVSANAYTYLEDAARTPRPPAEAPPLPQALTPQRLMHAYKLAAGNLTRTARLLGVHRATLYRRMEALGLTRHDLAAPPEALARLAPAPDR